MNNAPTTPPTFNERTTRALINELTTNGGCTLMGDGVHAQRGFAVGLGGVAALDPKRSYYDQVHTIVVRARKSCAGTSFGAWHDSTSGLDYVEPVHIISTFEAAARASIERGEIAFYDLNTGREILTDDVRDMNLDGVTSTPKALLDRYWLEEMNSKGFEDASSK